MTRSVITRKLKVLIYIVLILAFCFLWYAAKGAPPLTMRQALRRAERANLVGPGEIIETLDRSQYDDFEKMIVAQSEHGVTFLGKTYSSRPKDPFELPIYIFSYQEKTGDVTLAVAPNYWSGIWSAYSDMLTDISLPVYIFTEHTDAESAKLRITVSAVRSVTNNEGTKKVEYTEDFSATAIPVDTGIFRCYLNAGSDNRYHALARLSKIVSRATYEMADADISATVWLYDDEGNEICSKELTLCQVADRP